MVSYDMQDFGGLEEYAVNLAIGLKQQGQAVSWLSAAWVSPQNQYARRLKDADIPLVQPPEWISKPASDWDTKERILRGLMLILSPLTFFLGLGLSLLKRRPFNQAWTSSHNWLKGRLMDGFIGTDYRKPVGRLLLNWWNWRWHPEMIHIQGYTTTLLFVIDWAHARGIPVAYEEHQTPDPQFNWWKGFESTINKADRVIAVSEKSAEGLREVCKVTRPIVVRNPLLSDPYPSGWQKDYNHKNDRPFTITTVARLYVTKGLTYLLDTAALVKKTHPNVQFKVYGEGELRDELLAKADGLGLDGKSIFVGAFTSRGSQLLSTITNDAWYGTTSAPHQHLAMAAFRAIENRRYLVRAANTGITAVVDPRGRVLEPTRLFDTTVLVREVPFVAETTFYTRHGDVFAQACAAMALALVAATFRRPSTRMDGRRHP